jgi:hypothetical protein
VYLRGWAGVSRSRVDPAARVRTWRAVVAAAAPAAAAPVVAAEVVPLLCETVRVRARVTGLPARPLLTGSSAAGCRSCRCASVRREGFFYQSLPSCSRLRMVIVYICVLFHSSYVKSLLRLEDPAIEGSTTNWQGFMIS